MLAEIKLVTIAIKKSVEVVPLLVARLSIDAVSSDSRAIPNEIFVKSDTMSKIPYTHWVRC